MQLEGESTVRLGHSPEDHRHHGAHGVSPLSQGPSVGPREEPRGAFDGASGADADFGGQTGLIQ